ncbi:hypothetical protein ECTOBSL9_2553 [Ectothiorhodospira sp. BSL-9]|nr:hypothetical protein ECTOBSL9_2553 [Ectothiorhodospira sp. BSL-9]
MLQAMLLVTVISALVFAALNFPDGMILVAWIQVAVAVFAALTTLGLSHFYERNRERSERELMRLATTDPLTGLANRMRLNDVFQRERAQAQRNGTALSLLVLDLDRFKQINDEHGVTSRTDPAYHPLAIPGSLRAC